MSNTVLFEVQNHVAWVTLNRPERLNAQNREMTDQLARTFERISADDGIRAAVIIGAGPRAFSTGGDLKELSDAPTRVLDRPDRDTFPGCKKPIIAAIHGYCLAAGFELALTCDIRIATPDAKFGLPEPRWSLMGGYGLHHLARMIPLGEALLIQLAGGQMDAQRAHQIGLVQRIVANEDLRREAGEIAGAIARNAPLAVQGIKDIVTTGRSLTPEQSWRYGYSIEQRVYRSQDFLEGSKAVAEKRIPAWSGR